MELAFHTAVLVLSTLGLPHTAGAHLGEDPLVTFPGGVAEVVTMVDTVDTVLVITAGIRPRPIGMPRKERTQTSMILIWEKTLQTP